MKSVTKILETRVVDKKTNKKILRIETNKPLKYNLYVISDPKRAERNFRSLALLRI